MSYANGWVEIKLVHMGRCTIYMTDTIPFIDELIEDFNKVQAKILPDEPTTAQNLSVHLTKILILSCASYYEQQLQNAYINYARQESDRYADKPHRFDDYRSDKNIYQKFSFGRIEDPDDLNQLPEIRKMLEPLKFFGEKFRDKIYNEINGDVDKERQLKAFQEIFAIRNLIAHQAFVEFTSNKIRNKSFLDIKHMHDDAIKFVEYLKEKFI